MKDMPRIADRPGKELPPLDFDKLKQDIVESYPEVIKLIKSLSYLILEYVFQ